MKASSKIGNLRIVNSDRIYSLQHSIHRWHVTWQHNHRKARKGSWRPQYVEKAIKEIRKELKDKNLNLIDATSETAPDSLKAMSNKAPKASLKKNEEILATPILKKEIKSLLNARFPNGGTILG